MFDAAMHAQLDSRFVSAPAEIRRAIYQHLVTSSSIHIFLSPQGRLQVSTCLEPPTSPPLGGYHKTASERRRRPADAGENDPTWARRLMSSWGPHWECEEASHTRDLACTRNLLFVCKKMFLDVCTMVLERATINVTDLATLELLSRMPDEEASGSSHLWNLANYAYPLIQKLHVALRLPLAVFEALAELQDDQAGSAAQSAGEDGTAVACTTWARACLRKIGNPFFAGEPPPPFAIERRFRQNSHGEIGADGILRINHEADFPITKILVVIFKYHDDPDSDWENVTEDDIREVEDYETMLWKRGSDVNAYLEEMSNLDYEYRETYDVDAELAMGAAMMAAIESRRASGA
ncbi:hypothetical protein PG988_012097 [Apiospora saccharicola]